MSINFIKQQKPKIYAEVGVFKGDTTMKVCNVIPKGSVIHLFDFSEKLKKVSDM